MPPKSNDAGRSTPSWRSISMILVVLGGICGVICLLVALGLPVGAAIGAVGGLVAAAVAVVHPPQRPQDPPRVRRPPAGDRISAGPDEGGRHGAA